MASEEVSKPLSLPPYPEEKDWSNKSSISNYIESTNGDVPAGHTNLLTDNLSQMKESGELVIVKNNYKRTDPNAPAKCGHRRPPKAKDSSAPEAADAPAKSRGRLRKDPNASPVPKKAKAIRSSASGSTGRPRGRPHKVDLQLAQNGVEDN